MDPPPTARPRVWWHWMNGNISKEGIRADLEWMNRTGIAGFQNFDAGLATPKIVEKRLVYMTPEWKDAFLFATRMADSLEMEMAIAGSPGWSESGGPWVKPEQAMKKYVWSETEIEGEKLFSGKLPLPPASTGSFQTMSTDMRNYNLLILDSVPEYYSDAVVVAYKMPEDDKSLQDMDPLVTASGGRLNPEQLWDGDLNKSFILPFATVGEKSWILFEFPEPTTIKALSLVTEGGATRNQTSIPETGSTGMTLESSDDGINYSIVMDIPSGNAAQNTYSFEPVTAKYFRLAILAEKPSFIEAGNIVGTAIAPEPVFPGTQIAELVLYPLTRVNHFEVKAGFATASELAFCNTPSVPQKEVIRKEDVIDLSSEMQLDGSLNWTPPPGRWKIIRLGYSLTGHQNGPASPEATGLEVDKLNPDHIASYFYNYLDQYKEATGGLMGKRGLQYIITDSWEAGTANWTDNMIEEFNSRNNYDIRKWIPVLTGRIVESAEASDRFLWDFRLTLGKMLAEYHYDDLTELLRTRGMARYTESHENGRAFIGDGIEVKRTADVPMSATWSTRTPSQIRAGQTENVENRHIADVRESASVSHIYGQNFVAAESMTAAIDPWGHSPESLKPTADMEMACGLNRFVIHTSVHQPADDKFPGLTLGRFGLWFNRHETWAEVAKPWIDYMARSCYMLQQGNFVADIAYLYGEDNNVTVLFGYELPPIPEGYNYDFINTDALVNVLYFEKGNIITPAGTSYRLLVLDESTGYMSLPVLSKIYDMVKSGAALMGEKPIGSPSLNDEMDKFKDLADELWGDGSGIQSVGKGKVYSGYTVDEVLKDLNISPDFEYTKPADDTEIWYIHRKLSNGDIYWVNNRNDRFENVVAAFRTNGKEAEIWDPVTGEIKKTSFTIQEGKTLVPLAMKPNDAFFVIFRNKAQSESLLISTPSEEYVLTVDGPWELSFQPHRGAPESIMLDSLMPWNEFALAGVKYFSGTATYTRNFEAPGSWFNGTEEIWIDLGEVQNIAEVTLNGKSLGIVWKKPFRVNLSSALLEGNNELRINVINLWVNRIIGDLQPGEKNPVTYTSQQFYQADSPLLKSGLSGPVEIIRMIKGSD